MNEHEIKKRLRKLIIFVITSVVVLFAGSIVMLSFLQNSLHRSTVSLLEAEVTEYKNRIMKQIDADQKILETLAVFFEYSNITDMDSFVEGIYHANMQNDFDMMGFFDNDKNGFLVSIYGDISYLSADELDEDARKVVEDGLNGESSVSRLFSSSWSKERVFAYAVPVHRDGQVNGVLISSDQMEIYADILSGNGVMGGNGYINLIGSDGKILIASKRSPIIKKYKNIFDGPYTSDKNREIIQQKLQNQERISESFKYEGKKYVYILDPVGINGWYIMCVSTADKINGILYFIIHVTAVVFVCIIILLLILISYGYKILKRDNNELIRLAYYDKPTGAHNMEWFSNKLREVVDNSGEGCIAVLNVRQFKFINEIFGKNNGDVFLRFIKSVLEKNLHDDEFFCRETSDQFIVFIDETEKEKIRQRLYKIIAQIEDSSIQSNSNYRIKIYCGIDIFKKEQKQSLDSIMTHIMFAVKKAKELHNDSIWFYDAELHKKEELENYIESHMYKALDNNEFKMFLQPKMKLDSGELGGAEALVRWFTAEGKTIYPDQFIPICEKNGFCVKLDIYMLECACRQIRKWIDNGIKPIPISVNQSRLLFYEMNYIDMLSDIIKKYDIPANLITLEILEGLAAEGIGEINNKIAVLQERGFKISMDDFGNGYSSLNILGSLNINELKLDRGFLMEFSNKKNDRARIVMENVVRLTKDLNISTVVEGVETENDENFIKELGCNYGQGYFYDKPMSAEEFNRKYM